MTSHLPLLFLQNSFKAGTVCRERIINKVYEKKKKRCLVHGTNQQTLAFALKVGFPGLW